MLYFLVYLFLEVLISVNISSALGGLMTFFEIILSAVAGIVILVNFRTTLMENFTAVANNCIDLEQFEKLNLFTLLGAILLILPGFLTDIIGVLMQFSIFTAMLVNRYNVKSGNCKTDYKQTHFEQTHIKKDSNVIDVEIISDHTSIK